MSRRKIGHLMKQLGLTVKTKKKFKPSVSAPIDSPLIAPNRLKRRFNVSYMNQVWVGDITQLKPSRAGFT